MRRLIWSYTVRIWHMTIVAVRGLRSRQRRPSLNRDEGLELPWVMTAPRFNVTTHWSCYPSQWSLEGEGDVTSCLSIHVSVCVYGCLVPRYVCLCVCQSVCTLHSFSHHSNLTLYLSNTLFYACYTTFKILEISKAFLWLIKFCMDLLNARYTDE